jgi:integrase
VLGEAAPPRINIHDLRHTHATLLLADREPVKTVSERLGHASITVTLAVYGHVMPGDQKRTDDRFTALVGEA